MDDRPADDRSKPPTLDYATPPELHQDWLARWWGRGGEDSFIGNAALMFALAVALYAAVSWIVVGTPLNCLTISVWLLAATLSCGGLLEPRTNKTFPIVSLGILFVYLLAALAAVRWL